MAFRPARRILLIRAFLFLFLLNITIFPLSARAESSVTVIFRGQLLRTSCREETVAQLLSRLDLETTDADTLSHTPETAIQPGMTLRVDRVLTREETYTTTLPHDTTTCYDPTLPEGTWEVLIPGRDGELRTTAEVTYVNFREISRNILTQQQSIAPVTEVIAQGTGPAESPTEEPNPNDLPIIEDGYIRLPSGEVLTYTGTATVRASAYTHTDEGCDLITSTGSRVHVGTVAVDPRYIPYGTRMFIMATSGSYVYGISEAEDCGGAIKGDRVDLYLPTYEECMEFGRRVCTVYYLG